MQKQETFKVETAEDLATALRHQLRLVASHSYSKKDELKLNSSDIQAELLELYSFTQYIERKAFEMRLYIEEFSIKRKTKFEEAIDAMKRTPYKEEGGKNNDTIS